MSEMHYFFSLMLAESDCPREKFNKFHTNSYGVYIEIKICRYGTEILQLAIIHCPENLGYHSHEDEELSYVVLKWRCGK